MPSTSFEYPTPDNALEFFNTVTHALLQHQPAEAIYGFAEQHGPRVLALPVDDDGETHPEAPTPAQCRAMARAFISSMPRPELRFATRTAPGPGAEDPCDCGSGLPYKACCDAFLQQVAGPALPNPLVFLLPQLPRRQWPDLAHGAIDPEMEDEAARLMLRSDASNDNLYDDYEALHQQLLDRAQALLELNLRFNRAEGKTLEWAFPGNRPALRLIAQHIHGDALRPASDETLARIE